MGDESLNDQRDPLPTRVDELPGLPPVYADDLEAALSALIGTGDRAGLAAPAARVVDTIRESDARFEIPNSAREVFADHLRLLTAWNGAINLTAIVEPGAMARLHVADSLAAVPFIAAGPHATLLDLGTGAGFPGIPLAAWFTSMRVTLVESVAKKAAFLQVVIEATDLGDRVAVDHRRAEAVAPGQWDIVTARAVGSVAELVELGLPLLAIGGRLLAWKRGDVASELEAATRAARALGGTAPRWVAHPASIARAANLVGHGVVAVTKARPTPTGLPRDPAARKHRPW